MSSKKIYQPQVSVGGAFSPISKNSGGLFFETLKGALSKFSHTKVGRFRVVEFTIDEGDVVYILEKEKL